MGTDDWQNAIASACAAREVAGIAAQVANMEAERDRLGAENERIANSHARLMGLLAEILDQHYIDDMSRWHRRAMDVMGADLYAALADGWEVPRQ